MFKLAIAFIASVVSIASAQNSFTYQGTLEDAGAPANGIYDMRFTLWTDAVVGAPDTQVGSTVTSPATVVTDGLFTVNLDLDDAAFQNQSLRYLQIQVRFAGDPTYTTLTPRQQVTYSPRAFHALTSTETENIQLPYYGIGSSPEPNGSLFSVLNSAGSGTAIYGIGPTFGVVGFGGIVPSHPGAPGASGVFGIGTRTGVAGSSSEGSGIYGIATNGTGGEFTVLLANPGNALEARTAGPGYAGIFRKTQTTGTTPALLVENNSTSALATGVHSIITSTSDLPPYSVPLPMLGQRRSFVPLEGCGA